MANPRVDFYGSNGKAIVAPDREILLAGPAGTGKSVALLWKVRHVAEANPGARVLIVRKTRSSLTESALVTFEQHVLGERHPVLTASPNMRKVRQSYRFPNGAEIIVGGMDKPEKTLSTEYDLIYIQDATELELDEYQTLFRALRAGNVRDKNGVPVTQIVSDCNPTYPHHWLYKRHQAGSLKMFRSVHKDNPRFWDRAAGAWTPDGVQYLDTLGALTGFLRKRFLEGVWAAAEGLVYDQFGPHNLKPRGWVPPKEWPRYHAIDFGFVNPLVYQFWAKDPDGAIYLYREIYRTGMLVEDLAKVVKADIDAGREPRPDWIIGDHDAEDRATFDRHSGMKVQPADKTKKAGIQDMATRFKPGANGRPQLYVVAGCVDRVDQSLAKTGKPTCTEEELSGYVWDAEKDEPVKENDHGCDAARYLCRKLARGGPVFAVGQPVK